MTPADSLNHEEVRRLSVIGTLTVRHLLAVGAVDVGAYEVRAGGDVFLDGPLYGIEGSVVRSLDDGELACFVLGEVFFGSPPPAVFLADRCEAEFHLHGGVAAFVPAGQSAVGSPCDAYRVFSGFQNCANCDNILVNLKIFFMNFEG